MKIKYLRNESRGEIQGVSSEEICSRMHVWSRIEPIDRGSREWWWINEFS